MTNKVFVGSLSWNTTSAELESAFAACGSVIDAKVVTDRDTGRSRGFGFVTFQDERGAALAIERLNGSTLDGRTIKVDQANERRSDNRSTFSRW